MRILRSQYLKYQAQQQLRTTKTTTKQSTTFESYANGATCTSTTRIATKSHEHSLNSATASGHVVTQRTTVRRNSLFLPHDAASALPTVSYRLVADGGEDSSAVGIPLPIVQRRQTIAHSPADILRQQMLNALRIKVHNPQNIQYSRINVVVQFYDVGTLWYTRLYHSYQDVLWLKLPRNGGRKNLRWYYKCQVCQRQLCSFRTLKFHLNAHMGFLPYRCVDCTKCYAGSNSLYRHSRSKHADIKSQHKASARFKG